MKQYEGDGKKNVEILQIFGANNRMTLFHILVDVTKIKISMKNSISLFDVVFSNLPDFQKFPGLLHNLPTVKKKKTCSKNGFVESEVGTPRTPRHFLEMMVAQRSSLQGYRRSTGDFFPTTWILGLDFCFLAHKKNMDYTYNKIWSKMNGK